jgi:hypothetical protein
VELANSTDNYRHWLKLLVIFSLVFGRRKQPYLMFEMNQPQRILNNSVGEGPKGVAKPSCL